MKQHYSDLVVAINGKIEGIGHLYLKGRMPGLALVECYLPKKLSDDNEAFLASLEVGHTVTFVGLVKFWNSGEPKLTDCLPETDKELVPPPTPIPGAVTALAGAEWNHFRLKRMYSDRFVAINLKIRTIRNDLLYGSIPAVVGSTPEIVGIHCYLPKQLSDNDEAFLATLGEGQIVTVVGLVKFHEYGESRLTDCLPRTE